MAKLFLQWCGWVISMPSRPVRARGLKLVGVGLAAEVAGSRPVRARGLKLARYMAPAGDDVAPRAGAWIETPHAKQSAIICDRRAPCGRVD